MTKTRDLDLDAIRSDITQADIALENFIESDTEHHPALIATAIRMLRRSSQLLAEVERLRDSQQQATKLLDYAYILRAHGERAPGGNETWREFDRRLEAFLQATLDKETGDE